MERLFIAWALISVGMAGLLGAGIGIGFLLAGARPAPRPVRLRELTWTDHSHRRRRTFLPSRHPVAHRPAAAPTEAFDPVREGVRR